MLVSSNTGSGPAHQVANSTRSDLTASASRTQKLPAFLRVCTAVQKIVHAREFMISLDHACCMQAFGNKELNIKIMFKFSKPRTLDTGWTSRRNSTDVHKCVELINQSITCLVHIYHLFLHRLNHNFNF